MSAKKIYVTSEISPLLGRFLKELSGFEKADVFFGADLVRDGHLCCFQAILDYDPTLIITRKLSLPIEVDKSQCKAKIILLRTQNHDTYEKFWLNAYHLGPFVESQDKIFEIR